MVGNFNFAAVSTGEITKVVGVGEIDCSELPTSKKEVLENLPRFLHAEDEISFSCELENVDIKWRYISFLDQFGKWHTFKTL